MKKISFLIFVVLLVNALAAQNFRGGISGGLSAAQVDGDSYGGYSQPGANVGAFIYIPFSDNISCQMDFRLLQKGARRIDKDTLGNILEYYNFRSNYMEIPIVANILYKNKVSYEGGVSFGYQFKSKVDFDGHGFIDVTQEMNKYDFGFILGVNYNFKEHFWINFRHQMSLVSVSKAPPSGYYPYRSRQYNRLLSFALYYVLGAKQP